MGWGGGVIIVMRCDVMVILVGVEMVIVMMEMMVEVWMTACL